MRKQGILLPISSIPSDYGIGTFGRESYRFVDFLKKAGQKLWQILPLGPTGYGASPYQSFSTFAGNPYYISLEALIKEGVLTKEECDAADLGNKPNDISYHKLYNHRRCDICSRRKRRRCFQSTALWRSAFLHIG